MARVTNVKRATVQGAVAPTIGSVAVAWGAAELSRRWQIPVELAGGLIGAALAPVSALYARWLAKLSPHE